jgi:fructokinase
MSLFNVSSSGVGVGLVLESRPVHGLMHPEAAHIKCERLSGDDYPGDCPYHGACIEGMCNAKSAADRLGILPSQLSSIDDDHPVWNVQAYYIAQLCAATIYLTSVKRIVIGGGLTKRKGLFEHIRKHVQQILNNYINVPTIMNDMDKYIVPSQLGDVIGIQSAFDLAQRLIESH